MSDITLKENSTAPDTPDTGFGRIYFKDDGSVYAKNDAGTETALGGGGGSGTVTSVGLSTNAGWLTVGSSPVTSSGTITLNTATGQTANQVLASPDSSPGAVALRALVAADIPNLAASKITSGTLGLVRGGTGVGTVASGNLLLGAGTSPLTALAGTNTGDFAEWNGSAWTAASRYRVLQSLTEFTTNTSAITLSSIPATYKHLRLRLGLRSDRAANAADGVNIEVNNDTTATNYYSVELRSVETAPADYFETLGSSGYWSFSRSVTAATAATNGLGYLDIWIWNYSSTTFQKAFTAINWIREVNSTNSLKTSTNQGTWLSTSAITELEITPNNGTNFTRGWYELTGYA